MIVHFTCISSDDLRHGGIKVPHKWPETLAD